MKKIRIIARLDIKGPNVIKGVQFECLRVMGKPKGMAEHYYLQGADELIYLDTVASLYQRQKLIDIVNESSECVHIPFTIGGGVRTLDDIRELLKAGADKVAINTEATRNPELIRFASRTFGSQCIVASIEAKKVRSNKWEVYVDHGRQRTGLDAIEWAKRVEELGAGEILLTSVDMDGTEQGLDLELIKRVSGAVSVSLVVSGGVGNIKDFVDCIKDCRVDGIAAASIFHYQKYSIKEVKEALFNEGINVRRAPSHVAVSTDPRQEYDILDYNKFTLRQLKEESLTKERLGDVQEVNENSKDITQCDIGVIDYGINNLKSVIKSFERIGKMAKWIDTPEEVFLAKCLVLPGVGTFKYGMDGLKNKGLVEPIKEKARTGTPLLGICLGMQLLFERSEEFGLHNGLGLIPGSVVALKPPEEIQERGYKVPHIGWNQLRLPSFRKVESWNHAILGRIEPNSSVYFVHSFHAVPKESRDLIATAEYGGQEFCAVSERGNIVGMQFHPEKSGQVGLDILKYFCDKNRI